MVQETGSAPTFALSGPNLAMRQRADGLLMGMRVERYSWWTHWREIADYMLPRRYKWLVTPNQMARGSPINQHILDSTATLAARNLAAGLMSGVSSPTRRWFDLRVGHIDTTQTSPASLWLAECHRLMTMVFASSNFYSSMAVLYLDLVVFGTAVMLIYEDFDEVIRCHNPCLGEFYLSNNQSNRPTVFCREFTYTVRQTVEEFGIENCSPTVQALWRQGNSGLTKEVVIAHLIEPNEDAAKYGFNSKFKFREVFWEWTGVAPQGGASYAYGFLRKRGFFEPPHIPVRWDLVSNDPYGRSPGMDALPDTKQLQLETRRKAQGVDKMVNPPLVADIQLKNQPASLLPGGVTYVTGYAATGKPGFSSVYDTKFPVGEMMEDLKEVRERIRDTFYNRLFQMISQYEPKSNITAVEIDARRSEQMVMLSPVLERINEEGLKPIIERVFNVMLRANILPPAPPEIQGMEIEVDFVSMLEQAQDASAAAGIERVFGLAGNLAGIDPSAVDNVDIDYGVSKISSLLNNDPKLIRSPDQLAQIRQARQEEKAQAQQAAQVDQAEKLAKGAKNLADIDVGGSASALGGLVGL